MLYTMKKPTAITPILKSMSLKLGLEKEMGLYRLQEEWAQLVGETIAQHTAPEKMQFKTLTLLVDSPVWMHELTFLKTGLIEKINKHLGAETVKTLHLKVNASLPHRKIQTKKIKRRSFKILDEKDKAVITQELSSVSDDHLKKWIQKAMEKHLRSKKPD